MEALAALLTTVQEGDEGSSSSISAFIGTLPSSSFCFFRGGGMIGDLTIINTSIDVDGLTMFLLWIDECRVCPWSRFIGNR